MPFDPVLPVVLLILAVVLFEAWFVFDGRARPPKGGTTFTAGHVHQGTEVSRHENAGRTVVVAECHVCHGHFNLEMP